MRCPGSGQSTVAVTTELVVRVGFIIDGDNRSDSTPCTPDTLQCGMPRLDLGYEVVENAIGNVFVENALVAKLLQVKFEAFQFHAQLVGYIGKRQRAKVGLAGLGTHGREFRAIDFNLIVAIRKAILEDLEVFLERGAHGRVFSKFF